MSKYIDADALAKKLTDWSTGTVEPIDWSDIAVAPSIDIVRCGECKYWRNKGPEQIPTASIMCGHMHPDDFCSYGEKESNGNQKI